MHGQDVQRLQHSEHFKEMDDVGDQAWREILYYIAGKVRLA